MLSTKTQALIKNLKIQMAGQKEYAAEAVKFNALSDFERGVLMRAAGVPTSFFNGQHMQTVKSFADLKRREQIKVAKVFPLVAALGARLAA